jgi:lysophospholipase L1-like esterase
MAFHSTYNQCLLRLIARGVRIMSEANCLKGFMRLQFVLLLLCLLRVPGVAADDALRLTLPPEIFAVVGVETNIHFANTVLAPADQELSFQVECPVGVSNPNKWTLNARSADVGSALLTIHAKTSDGTKMELATTTVRIVPADAGADQDIQLLIVGDSLTHASIYPNEIARLLNLPGNPKWRMLGTHRPAGAADGVAHEGYGGWTWALFNSKFDESPQKAGVRATSPFVFADDSGKPTLNVTRYFEEQNSNQPPDFIIVMLGINDCFSFNPEDPEQLDARIDGVFVQAEKLIAEFRTAAPTAQIGLCLTTPGNSRDEAFVANYQDRYSRWGWRRIQHRLVERQIRQFRDREEDQIFLIPTELNLDVVDGYPANNAVHPNALGYQQIGTSIYAWLKWHLSVPPAETHPTD